MKTKDIYTTYQAAYQLVTIKYWYIPRSVRAKIFADGAKIGSEITAAIMLEELASKVDEDVCNTVAYNSAFRFLMNTV